MAEIGRSGLVAWREFLFRENPRVQALISDLRLDSSDPPEISYSIEKAIKNIELRKKVSASSNIAICSVAIGPGYGNRVRACLDSHRRFAETNGFSYFLLEERPLFFERPPSWAKIPIILKLLLDGYVNILYIDADALITNMNSDIVEQFARLDRSKKPILLTEDDAGANLGILFVKNIPSARRILDLIWLYDADIENGTWEQKSLITLMEWFSEVRRNIEIEPNQKLFNSFPMERASFHAMSGKGNWSAGDFICHFSGIRSPHLEELIEKYEDAKRC